LPLWIKNWGGGARVCFVFPNNLSLCFHRVCLMIPSLAVNVIHAGALSPSSHLIYDLFIHIDCKLLLLLLLFINLSLIICILNFIYYREVPSLFNPSWSIVFLPHSKISVIRVNILWYFQRNLFYFFNVGIRVNLCVSRLIPRVLKLTIM